MTTCFTLQEAIDMIYENESDVDGNQSEYEDSDSDGYSSDDGGDHSGETEGSSVDSIDGEMTEVDENRPPQGTGTSHVTGGRQGTHRSSGMSTKRGRRSGKGVKSNYKWEEVGAGEWLWRKNKLLRV